MRWNTGKYTIIEVHRAQELEPVEQPVRRGGVIARLNPAQPDEAADRPRQHLGSQSVEPITGDGIETGRDPLLDPTFGDRKSVVEGKRVAVRGDLGGRRIIKKK